MISIPFGLRQVLILLIVEEQFLRAVGMVVESHSVDSQTAYVPQWCTVKAVGTTKSGKAGGHLIYDGSCAYRSARRSLHESLSPDSLHRYTGYVCGETI